MSKRQAALTSFGFGVPGSCSSTPPPAKLPVTAGRDLPAARTDPGPSTSAGTIDSRVTALKFSDLHPPYDLGQVLKFARQLSEQER